MNTLDFLSNALKIIAQHDLNTFQQTIYLQSNTQEQIVIKN